MAVTLNASTTTGLVQSADTSGIIELQNNGTTKLTVNSSGATIPTATITTGTITTLNAPSGVLATQNGMTGIAKAWVNFDGTLSSPITPRGSYNISSVIKNSTGDYSVNFTTSMPNVNYSICGTAGAGATYNAVVLSPYAFAAQSTSGIRFRTFGSASTLQDEDLISIAILSS